jgi:hypothetical protein
MAGFAEFRPQNSAVAAPEEIGGGTWRHKRGCVKAKQLRVERVVVKSKLQLLVHFSPGGVDRLYVNMGNFEMEITLYK